MSFDLDASPACIIDHLDKKQVDASKIIFRCKKNCYNRRTQEHIIEWKYVRLDDLKGCWYGKIWVGIVMDEWVSWVITGLLPKNGLIFPARKQFLEFE